jgi:hypothetical protein
MSGRISRGERAPRWTTYAQGLEAGVRSAVRGDVPDEAHAQSSEDWRRGYTIGYRAEDARMRQAKRLAEERRAERRERRAPRRAP